jgi:hypothetical protein
MIGKRKILGFQRKCNLKKRKDALHHRISAKSKYPNPSKQRSKVKDKLGGESMMIHLVLLIFTWLHSNCG